MRARIASASVEAVSRELDAYTAVPRIYHASVRGRCCGPLLIAPAHPGVRLFRRIILHPPTVREILDMCGYPKPVSSCQALNCACILARSRLDFVASGISRPSSRSQVITSFDSVKPS